ncbi:hypothetical protein [Cryptosporangium phraense]|uniref:DUF4386 family protein n=1 Tax=Cryptosporangium phraense TaxID=2593070 RepID=A0A545ALM6_9ACTN|nr:hypothetical protein [Cryptosporangium phraense]TQS42228.1 hypothetical protein FL583_25140 [Cryptosporangium phraense]
MPLDRARLAGLTLLVGSAVASLGYLAGLLFVGGSGDARYDDPLWTPLYGIALAGDLLIVLGLPAVLIAQGRRAARLTLIGYVGLYAALVMLNICEGCLEAFVKPYVLHHGGIPTSVPGWGVFEGVALVLMLIGLIGLGVAVIRAKVFAWWVGVLLIASPFGSFVLPSQFALLSDFLAYAALFVIGLRVARTHDPAPVAA